MSIAMNPVKLIFHLRRGDWKTTSTCSTSLGKHQKRRLQQFSDVSGIPACCDYYEQAICNQILGAVYGKAKCSNTFTQAWASSGYI